MRSDKEIELLKLQNEYDKDLRKMRIEAYKELMGVIGEFSLKHIELQAPALRPVIYKDLFYKDLFQFVEKVLGGITKREQYYFRKK